MATPCVSCVMSSFMQIHWRAWLLCFSENREFEVQRCSQMNVPVADDVADIYQFQSEATVKISPATK
jgi:hypothetical protein